MVMHARKTQRISDGYFEKHQSHPYQNSKYGSSKSGTYSSSNERYERMRDSPNGNSYRSDSPDSQSPRDRDRSYQNKSSYLQKIREKERENRDYKSSRDKYSDCVRSPKDKRNRDSRDSEHRTNHDRSGEDKMILHSIKVMSQNSSRDRKLSHNCQEKREERERINRVGDWSEHISSSGKKYYYNCKTEVSQWEKPREWVERERNERSRDRSSCKERGSGGSSDVNDRSYGGSASRSTSTLLHDKHSTVTRSSNSSISRDKSISGGGSTAISSRSSWPTDGERERDRDRDRERDRDNRDRERDRDPLSITEIRRRSEATVDSQDMDISPGDSTPTSEASREPQSEQIVATGPVLLATALPRLSSSATPPQVPPIVPPPSSGAPPPGQASGLPNSVQATVTSVGGTAANVSNLITLPRLISQITTHKSLECSTDSQSLQSIHSSLTMTRTDVPTTVAQPLKVETNSHTVSEGPPTPTHSEGQDYTENRKLNSPPSSLSSLGALRPQGPSLTPSLANHYRDDLVNHIRGWPADILEKQAQKLEEEAHVTGSLQCTKVSADLKIARSLVRLTEIQATLQEQRILFLRQQIKTLEELKSQNSFMSDDS